MIADRLESLVLPINLAMRAGQTPDQISAMQMAEGDAELLTLLTAYRAELHMKDTAPWSIAFWMVCITFYTIGTPEA